MRRNDLERPIHKAILCYLRAQYPRSVIHHSPNEMNLVADPRSKAIAQNKAKALGMRAGWPDLEMLLGGQMYFFEVKSAKGVISIKQTACGADIKAAGGMFFVVRSVDDVKAAMAGSGLGMAQVPIVGDIT